MSTRRKGVLFVANYSNRTGYAWNNIYRLFQELAGAVRTNGMEPWVSFSEFHPPLDWPCKHYFVGVLELPSTPTSIANWARWIQAIRKHEITHVYLTDQPSWRFGYALLRLVGVRRIIVHCRVSVPEPLRQGPDRPDISALKAALCRLPWIAADRVYAVSDFVRDRLIRKARVPADRVVTILNGVDLERFKPTEPVPNEGRVEIFCGARASVYKGIQVLIEAAAILRDRFGMTNFIIRYAGDGPDIARFRSLVSSLSLDGFVEFLGEAKSTNVLLAAADVVVVPSIWGDACPSSVSEALASGKALIATSVGGVPELVGDDGAAICIPHGDALALASALHELISDPMTRLRLGKAARARAEKALDQRRYHAQVIEHLLADLQQD